MARLREQRVRLVMLTGDNPLAAKVVALEGGIDEAHACSGKSAVHSFHLHLGSNWVKFQMQMICNCAGRLPGRQFPVGPFNPGTGLHSGNPGIIAQLRQQPGLSGCI